ncbi:hypothetical protein D3C87_1304620 [compost metagenome]
MRDDASACRDRHVGDLLFHVGRVDDEHQLFDHALHDASADRDSELVAGVLGDDLAWPWLPRARRPVERLRVRTVETLVVGPVEGPRAGDAVLDPKVNPLRDVLQGQDRAGERRADCHLTGHVDHLPVSALVIEGVEVRTVETLIGVTIERIERVRL